MTIECALKAEIYELYDTESHLAVGLTTLHKRSQSKELRSALADQREQTQEHVRRLERIFSEMKWPISRGSGEVVDAIFRDAESFWSESGSSQVGDAYFVGTALRSQSLLIAGYRQAAVLADALSLPHLHRSLQGSLQEEMESAERFADLSKAEIIPLAI